MLFFDEDWKERGLALQYHLASFLFSPMEKSSPETITAGDAPVAPSPPPTTYVQADAATFKELVQRLTGPHDDPPSSTASPSTSFQKLAGVRRPAFKLHERRQASRSKLSVLKPLVSPRLPPSEFGFSSAPGRNPLVSPSTQLSALAISDGRFPAAVLSELNGEEEERAIRERRFYLHPSPRSGPRSAEPELLTLFPLTSPSAK